MTIQNNDFIELEFTGRISDNNEIFDTNVESISKENNLDLKNLKPFILRVGKEMLPPGLDKDLVGKEEGKEYTVEIKAEDAFGKRNKELIKMVPTKLFHQQNINPERGMRLNLDNQLVNILSSSGGRTLVDFNNPLAGKDINYTYKILKKVTDDKSKVDAVQDFLFRKEFNTEVSNGKAIFKVKADEAKFIEAFKPKIEDLTGMSIEIKTE